MEILECYTKIMKNIQLHETIFMLMHIRQMKEGEKEREVFSIPW